MDCTIEADIDFLLKKTPTTFLEVSRSVLLEQLKKSRSLPRQQWVLQMFGLIQVSTNRSGLVESGIRLQNTANAIVNFCRQVMGEAENMNCYPDQSQCFLSMLNSVRWIMLSEV